MEINEVLLGAVKASSVEQAEHVNVNGVHAKRVVTSGFDGVNLQDILLNEDGSITVSATLFELLARIASLASVKNPGIDSLRCMLITGSTTAVTGSLTSAGTVSTATSLTNFGGYPAYTLNMQQGNVLAELGNIANVTVS